MKRFNYRPSLAERLIGRRPTVRLDQPMRRGIAVVGLAVGLIAVTALVESQRLSRADAALSAIESDLAAIRRAARRDGVLDGEVHRLRSVAEAVATARRTSVRATNDMTRIGNALPPDTWLTRLQTTANGAWTITGRSPRVDRVGSTMEAIARIDRRSDIRLVSVDATGPSGSLLDFMLDWNRTL